MRVKFIKQKDAKKSILKLVTNHCHKTLPKTINDLVVTVARQ